MDFFFSSKALKDIKKLTPNMQKRLIKKLDYFCRQKDPLKFSEVLIDNNIGSYRYRIGDYRVVFDVEKNLLIILRIGHRKEIYT